MLLRVYDSGNAMMSVASMAIFSSVSFFEACPALSVNILSQLKNELEPVFLLSF